MGKIRCRKDGRFFLDYRDEFGRRIRETVDTDSEKLALQLLKKRETLVFENKHFDIKRIPQVKLSEFTEEVLDFIKERKKSYKTFFAKCVKPLLRYFGNNRMLQEIDVYSVTKYQTERKKQVSKATVNRELAVLKRIFNLAIEWNKAFENPVRKVKFFKESKGRVRFLEFDEIDKLLDNCSGQIKNIVLVALCTGMRRGEILGLKWRNADLANRLIILEETKNDEIREIPIGNQLMPILMDLKRDKSSEDYVFTKKDGKPYKDIKNSFKKALKNAEIKNFRFHDLRHTFASHLVMAGVDLNTVKELLGHKDINTTMRYAHLSPHHKRQAINIFEQRMDTRFEFGQILGKFQSTEKMITDSVEKPLELLKL